ncbi:hypothetical protein ACSDR0_31620 [Streptosporangium sp. G11]|uniref:hypothetical protein n=1 Tax=Streptosporangium sp. G11 TaxID=3436926 RepID=UPI003EB96DA4
MRDKQGFPGLGAIVAGAVVCGVLATPGVALAIPASDPAPMPPSAQPSAQIPASMPPSAQVPVEVSIVGGAGKTGAGGSSSLSALPFLGHFGGPVGRTLRGRITLANPAGRTPAFRVVDPTLLPAGITLDADGLLGGASRVPGTWTVPVEACAPLGGCTAGTVTITITCRCAPAPPSPPADTSSSPVSTSSSHVGTPCSAGDVITE